MAVLTVQEGALGGLNVAFTAAAASDTFVNNGNTRLRAKNSSGGAINVEVDSIQACNQGFDHNMVASVPASGELTLGPFPVGRFGSPVVVTTPTPASITYAVVRN